MAKRQANPASQPVPVDGHLEAVTEDATGTGELVPVEPGGVAPPDLPLRAWDVRTRGRVLCRVEAANSTEAIAEAVRQFHLTRPDKFAFEALPV